MQNNCRRMTFQIKMHVTGLNHCLKSFTCKGIFHSFTFCNQLPDFSISGTLAANELKPNIFNKNFAKLCREKNG